MSESNEIPPPRVAGRFRGKAPDRDFDPKAEGIREALMPLIRAIEEIPDATPEPLAVEIMEPLLRRHPFPGGGFFSRSQLIAGFRTYAESESFRFEEARFRRRVQTAALRLQAPNYRIQPRHVRNLPPGDSD